VTFWRARAAVLGACASVACAGCGGDEKAAPTQRDASAITAAVSDIVYQCQSAAAGFIAGPDQAALRRDVDALVRAYDRLRPDAAYRVGAAGGPSRRTTLRQQAALAERNLSAECAPKQASRVRSAME
jgi:hypothetical protein